MSLAVRIAHPAWATYVPARGRNERTRIVEAHTETFVAEAPASAFEAAPIAVHERNADPTPILVGEEALWRPVGGLRADGRIGDAHPSWFARALAGGPGVPDAVGWAFAGTPIRATEPQPIVTGRAPSHPHGHPDPGERVDLDGVRSLVADGRADAARAVRDFVASEIRIAGDRVLRRYRPVGLVMTGQDRRGTPLASDREHLPADIIVGRPPYPEWYDAYPTRPSTLEAALDRIPARRRPAIGEAVRTWMGFGDAVTGARDGACLVDGYVGSVAALLREMLAIQRRGNPVRPQLQAALDRIRPHARAALTGTPDADVADALAAMEAGLAVLNRHPPVTDYHHDRKHLRLWIREHYRPELERIPEADDESLSGLGPRP